MSNDDTGRDQGDNTDGLDATVDPTIDFGDEFGVIKFADTDDSGPAIAFGSSDTGPLPHWTDMASGEIPRFMKPQVDPPRRTAPQRDEDQTDVWSAYNGPDQSSSGGIRKPPIDLTHDTRRFEATPPPPSAPTRREGRIVIGTDPTGERRRPVSRDASGAQSQPIERPRQASGSRNSASSRPQVTRGRRSSNGSETGSMPRKPSGIGGSRDLPMATAVGALLAAVFIGSLMVRPAVVMVLIAVLIGLAAFEFFTQANESGYRPSTVIGVVGCIAAPLTAYWVGDAALPLVFVFGFIATVIVYVGSSGIESGPIPNTAITMFALVWIGLLSSYAALILRWSTMGGSMSNVGTDTLFIIVMGVIANDTAAYFVGSAMGRTPLRDWISPSKSVEGLIGGTVGTFVAVIVVGMRSTTWNSMSEWLLLALVISVMAPLGDLAESMFKRNLNIKDFGTILRGHGGALDRFDSMLFTLPAVYYLAFVMTPWR